MKRVCWLVGVLTCALGTGCVERRFVIEAVAAGDPGPERRDLGAQVVRNGQLIGFTPVDDSFVYYGKYHFTLIKDGYETLSVVQAVHPPWWEIPPLDFITENLLPFKFRDVRRLTYAMQPLRTVPPSEVLERAKQLRIQGQAIGEQAPVPVAPAAPAAPAGPPGSVPAVPAVPAAPAGGVVLGTPAPR